MKVVILCLVFFYLTFSCKAAKERRQCIEFVGEKGVLDIDSFKEFKTHVEGTVDYDKVLWVRDSIVSSKKEILVLINNRNILSINSLKGASGIQLDGALNGVLLITTNQCLNKTKIK